MLEFIPSINNPIFWFLSKKLELIPKKQHLLALFNSQHFMLDLEKKITPKGRKEYFSTT
jgi:hypothetical protein